MIRYTIYQKDNYDTELVLATNKEEEADALKNFLELVHNYDNSIKIIKKTYNFESKNINEIINDYEDYIKYFGKEGRIEVSELLKFRE